MNTLITYLIGASGITTTLIFIAKFIIKWIGEAGIEKYKNELNKKLEEFKIKYSRLHLEQFEIIKNLYSQLIRAEKPLEELIRPLKINPRKTEEELSKEVYENALIFFDYFDENEIIFNEETCEIIKKIKEKYIKVWNTYTMNTTFSKSVSGEIYAKILDEIKQVYDEVLKGEMQTLKNELKQDFRKKIGILEN